MHFMLEYPKACRYTLNACVSLKLYLKKLMQESIINRNTSNSLSIISDLRKSLGRNIERLLKLCIYENIDLKIFRLLLE
jgi:hypothetical protein